MAISKQLSDTLRAAGINVNTSICSYSELQDQLAEMTERFQDDVKKTIDELSYKSFGNFFIVTAALLAEALGGAAVALVDHYVAKALFENVLGAVSGAMSMLFASVPGAMMILKYYAASALKTDVKRRYDLAKILLQEVRTILYWVSVLAKTPVEYQREYFSNLNRAFNHVARARRLINMEATKYINRSNYVSVENIQTAITDIDSGIGYLTPGFKETNALLKSLHKDYKLSTPLPSIAIESLSTKAYTEYGNWFKYIKEITTELKNKYSGEDGKKELQAIIFRMVPALPDFLRKFAINTVISRSSKVLVDRFPIWILKNDTIDKYITKRFETDTIPDWLGVVDENREYSMFSNADTKDITWQRIMTATKLSESALLLIPTFMEIMEQHSGLVQSIISPADSYLRAVYDDMKATIKSKTSDSGSSQQMLLNKKFGNWILKLEQAKTLLRTVGAEHGLYLKGYGGLANLNTADITRAMDRINSSLTKLEDFISAKTLDQSTGIEKTEYGDQVVSLANNYLLSLVGKSAVFALNLLNPGVATNTIAGLRAIETLLIKQIELDEQEYYLSQNVLTAIETLPTFTILRRQIDNMLNQLEAGNSALARTLVDQVRHGDLSGIASYLDVASFATGATSCLAQHYINQGGKNESVLTRIQNTLTVAGVSTAQQLGISSAISGLKKKYAMLKEMTKIIDLEAARNG
jgi:hypothetical protein